ncbi:transcriptional regulator [Microlunatus soli]|uniref:Transcriptional regulator n=1 Tax=Microlunatus soli TaxID=630515 RepID=A0A1H1ZXC2_9ACTN|nr:transcriptional regulator [Microlunatus soli]SDT38239.1 hypothetical protein SAMN04489812_5515 [Microlunatus soli]
MSRQSTVDLLALHAVRILGFADTPVIAARFGLDPNRTSEALADAEAVGWVGRTAFGDLAGWSLTDAGRVENERQLAAELDGSDGAATVRAGYRDFLPWNARLQRACTDWQVRPTVRDRLAANDHADPTWDARVLAELAAVAAALPAVVTLLAGVLARFGGYDTRFGGALDRVRAGQQEWVNGTTIDSCHRVWFELHEDLLATLGIDRSSESPVS